VATNIAWFRLPEFAFLAKLFANLAISSSDVLRYKNAFPMKDGIKRMIIL
jgi:hypothetical protein